MKSLIAGFLALFAVAAQADIIFFVDNPNRDQKFEHSWGFATKPSELELVAGKVPVTSEHAFNGRDSLLLRWTSSKNGDWGICVATAGWMGHDFTTCTFITFKVNGPSAIDKQDLPGIAVEDMNNHKSDRVWMGDYLDGIDDDATTWQDVAIPVADIPPGSQQCDFKAVKSIYFFQRATDGAEHMVWVDDLRVTQPGSAAMVAPAAPTGVMAVGRDGRIDVRWNANLEPGVIGYSIYRADQANASFLPRNEAIHATPVYSDVVRSNGETYFYYVTAINHEFQESPASATVTAESVAMHEKTLVTYAQEAAFRYFYDYGHPVSGLARERKGSGDICTVGGTGFGLMTLMVGADRGFITREEAAARILKILRFLGEKATRHHGAWPHWIHGVTGATIPFSEWDNGGDLVETAYLVQGLLTVRRYFDRDTPEEAELRKRATAMWESVEWDWYRRLPKSKWLNRYWSPDYEWRMDKQIYGFNEEMITYLLAIAAPNHGIPASMYYDGWASEKNYENGQDFHGHKLVVGPEGGGPLFAVEYSFVGFDPSGKRDKYCNYFDHAREVVLANRAYCAANPKNFKGYSDLCWGLSASDNPNGYGVQSPKKNDNGTITPNAVLSAMPFAPKETVLMLRHIYRTYGSELWGEFGFRSAFNPAEDWYAKSYVGTEMGTIAPMIENARTRLCWRMFMANPEIAKALNAIGWVEEKK
ncbi:MAG: glucoamylase family protein [bacterium]